MSDTEQGERSRRQPSPHGKEGGDRQKVKEGQGVERQAEGDGPGGI